jgi:LuxR family maltose regulon positive regulatory protein
VATSVLTTKLYVPPIRSELVPRPRLIEQLDDGLGRKLTLISAPAGFGKTTLLSEWIQAMGKASSPIAAMGEAPLPIAVAWISLDESDNDLVQFFSYVIAALGQIDAHLGQSCQAKLQASQPLAVKPFITSLINEIAASDTQLVLVLDDYHAITLPAIHEAMTFLLDHMPPQLHLVIASRADPPYALSRLRVRKQMTELRAIDLRFSAEEVTAFLNQVMGFNLASEEIATLERRTEGWIAGLQLAALSMGGLDDAHRHSFVAALTGDDRYILDYLVEEVLDRQPAHIQTFLLRTSILERLCGPLCDAVLDDAGEDLLPLSAQEILGRLDRDNLFLVPLDNRRHWYRYHHLFAELLRNQLGASRPDLVPALHRRASAWYAREDMQSQAIAHSLAARDWEQAAELIERAMNDMMREGEFFATMLGRLKALPEEVIRARPHFGVSYAWLLQITLQLDEVEPRLQEVEKTGGDRLSADLRLEIDVIRASLARQRRDLATAMRLSDQVLDALPADAAWCCL